MNAPRRIMLRAVTLLVILAIAAAAASHDFHGMTTRVIVGRTRVTVLLGLVNQDAAVLASSADRDQDGIVSEAEFTRSKDSLSTDVASRFLLTNNDVPLTPSLMNAHIASLDPVTSQPHEISITLLYTLPESKPFEKLFLDPNLFRELPGRPLHFRTPPQATQTNQVAIYDCNFVTFETTGTRTYETIVGNCE